jgi:hypothetical protein
VQNGGENVKIGGGNESHHGALAGPKGTEIYGAGRYYHYEQEE